jgi:hypothetical protein
MNLIQKLDGALGRLLLRCCAVVSFVGATAAIAFGVVVLADGHFVGVLALLLGAFFLWLGRLSWRDRSTLGEALNRDFEPASKRGPVPHSHNVK